jgi:hypothetical protein
MIRKVGNKYQVRSADGSKNLGTYSSKHAALKRLAQVEYYKHKK